MDIILIFVLEVNKLTFSVISSLVTASGCVFTVVTAPGRLRVSHIHYKVNRNFFQG